MYRKNKIFHIVENNCFMMKYIIKYAPFSMLLKIIMILIDAIITYVSLNFAKWIFDGIEMYDMHYTFILLISWSLINIFFNFILHISKLYYLPIYKINVSQRIFVDYISKSKQIDQINFQDTEFYNKYSRGLKEINDRANSVLNSLGVFVGAIIQVFVIVGEVYNMGHTLFSCCAMIVSFIGIFFSYLKTKLNYKGTVENTINSRAREYIKRISYQPEFATDLKIYNGFIEMLEMKYVASTNNYKKTIKKYAIKKLLLDFSLTIVNVCFLTIIPWGTIIFLLYSKTISFGDATLLIGATTLLPNKLFSVFNIGAQFVEHSLHIDDLREILAYAENIEKNSGEEFQGKSCSIYIKKVCFKYAAELPMVIRNLTLCIEQGDKLAIVGLNGAGKSTIVKLLLRLFDPVSGEILINNRDIRDYNVKDLRRQVGFLPQDYNIYNFSIAENILMRPMLTEEDRGIVEVALRKVGLFEKIDKWPDGINTFYSKEFNEGGLYLSGGEKQRLALARLYVADYKLIILDEPTSALDPISEKEFVSMLLDVFKDKTVIVISHKLTVVQHFSRICFINQGELVEAGSHDELMKLDKHYAQFCSVQSSGT